MAADIVALGEPLLELTASGEGPLGAVAHYDLGWGGDTSNFAIAASRLGGKSGYVCRIGADDVGRAYLALLQAERVDTTHVLVEESGFTGLYFVTFQDGRHSFTYYRKGSSASRLAPDDLPLEYIAQARLLHVSGITQAISDSACDAVFAAIDTAHEAGVAISYDPNIRLGLWSRSRARAVVLETICRVDLLLPSVEDMSILLGDSDPERMASQMLALGPRVVALKLGREGALLATQEGLLRIQGVDVDAVDATGAGDTFDAAFVVAYLESRPLEECARLANLAGALATTGRGAIGAIPTRAQLEAEWQGEAAARVGISGEC